MALEDDGKKPTHHAFPVVFGFTIGSMPAMLQLPLLSKIMFWLLGNVYFALFYVFMLYIPWMMGSILARMTYLHVLVPTIFCIFYWTVLGVLAGSPKHNKKAWFYIAIAHIFIPTIFLLNSIRFNGLSTFSADNLDIFNLLNVFSQMLGQ